MKFKIFATRALPGKWIDQISEDYAIDVWEERRPPTREEMLLRVKGVDGILCLLTDRIDEEVFDAAGTSLRVVSNYAVGFDNIDVASATARGIPVGNTPGVLTETTADLTFALLMAAARRIVEGRDFVRAGKFHSWSPDILLGRDVHGARLSIIGMGRIGRAVAKRAQGFEMEVLMVGRTELQIKIPGARAVSFEEAVARADFLSLHVPLNAETHRLIDAAVLAQMKPNSALINTARGGVVDHDALYHALCNGPLGFAALDVTEPEPLPAEHPLHGLDNCLILPHLGSASTATRTTMARLAKENLIAGLLGKKLPFCVNPEVYEGCGNQSQ